MQLIASSILTRTLRSLRAIRSANAGSEISINVGVRAVCRFYSEDQTRLVDNWVRHEMHASSGIEIRTVLDAICEALIDEVGPTREAIGRLDELKTHVSETIRRERRSSVVSNATESVDAVIEALHQSDADLAVHLTGVGELAGRIALSMDFSPHRVEYVYNAGRMHDIGKTRIPRQVLYKPGVLTAEEFEDIKRHAELGEQLLHEVPGMEKYALATRLHHEALDGSGYPDGLRADHLPMEIRIVSVADVYDALTNRRCYREAWKADDALRLLHRGKGTRWDADVIAHLEHSLAQGVRRELQIA